MDMGSLNGQKDRSTGRLQRILELAYSKVTHVVVGEGIQTPTLIYLVLTHKWWCTAFVTLNRVSSILTRTSKCCSLEKGIESCPCIGFDKYTTQRNSTSNCGYGV